MATQTLKAQPREILGRKVKKLRQEGVLPANLYGKKIKSESLKVDAKDFKSVYANTGETGLVELVLAGKKRPVLIHNVQTDPVTDIAIHADFLQVDLKTKVTAQVPVELTGESPAEKEGKGTVVLYLDEVEVEALPVDLLEKFEIDLTKLVDVDEAIKVEDLKFNKAKVEVKNDLKQIIVKVEPPRKEEEEPTPEVKSEVEGEEVPAEESAAVEGEQKTQESKEDGKVKQAGKEEDKSTEGKKS